jgi:hypothetical protein
MQEKEFRTFNRILKYTPDASSNPYSKVRSLNTYNRKFRHVEAKIEREYRSRINQSFISCSFHVLSAMKENDKVKVVALIVAHECVEMLA